MNYSHGIVNNVMQSIQVAYENDIMDANIIRCFVKMRIYIKINFLNAEIRNPFKIKNQKCQEKMKKIHKYIFKKNVMKF